MRILHYSDKAAPNFMELYRQCDLVISTGDLTGLDFPGLEDLPANERKPAFGVYGNHDSGTYFENLGIVNLHNQVYDFNGIKWGGWQGCLRYKTGPCMFTEDEAQRWADAFFYVDILLLHAGPKGMLDDPTDDVHVGSESVRRYILEKQPKIVFCGHQYSDDFMEVNNTRIYRTYGARIIEISL